MEPGAHMSAKDNVVRHDKTDFEVPFLMEDFRPLLPNGKLPPASKYLQNKAQRHALIQGQAWLKIKAALLWYSRGMQVEITF
ncbi:hypothetical protein V6N12_064963 [Hibiscus sabdariffa]|uniref:Uncharacterized protein n=1 Tax=Hibiscus sabdariffa TaxID=183260 RepID=A0ABR2G7A6_9ROSI